MLLQHNDRPPLGLSATSVCLTRGHESTLEPLEAFPYGRACARHAKGAGGALAVGADLVDFPRLHRSSNSSVRPSGHLTVGLLGSSQAFNGAVRKKFHRSDCLECVWGTANHP